MKKTLVLALTTSLFIAGCASASGDKKPMAMESGMQSSAIAQAEKDLNAAIEAQAQWKIIDKSTGKKAASMSKLLKTAKKKAEEGNMDEANRIAMRISEMTKISIAQSERYAGALPYYK